MLHSVFVIIFVSNFIIHNTLALVNIIHIHTGRRALSISVKPGSATHFPTSTTSARLQHLLVGAHVHLFCLELQVIMCGCRHSPTFSIHDNYWHPWVGTDVSHAAQNASGSSPWLQPKSLSAAVETREGINALHTYGFTCDLRCLCVAGMAHSPFTTTK